MGYKKPALVEQWLEIHFKKNALPVEHIFDIVPELKKEGFTKIEMGQFTKLISNENKNEIIPFNEQRVKCWKDKSDLIQISPDLLIINKLAPYVGWPDFKDILKTALIATKIQEIKNEVFSVNFVTFDRFIFSIKDFTVGKYFNCDGTIIPKWYEKTKESFDIIIGQGYIETDGFNYSKTINSKTTVNEVTTFINSQFHQKLVGREIDSCIEELHKMSTQSFESMITDLTRSTIMEGNAL